MRWSWRRRISCLFSIKLHHHNGISCGQEREISLFSFFIKKRKRNVLRQTLESPMRLPCRKYCRTCTPPQWPHEAVDHWFFPCVLSQPFQEYFLVCDPLKTSMVERHERMNCKEVVARKALVRIRSSTLVGGIEKCGVEISTGRSWTHKVEMEGWYEIIWMKGPVDSYPLKCPRPRLYHSYEPVEILDHTFSR